MDYRELREVMKFLHCKGLMAKDIYADMLDTLGDSAPSYAMVKKWVTEFRRGRTSTEDLIRSGRPRDVSTYENVDYIRNLIKDDERVTVQDIAKYVGISFGSVHAILSKLLELVKVSGRWVPRRVSNDRRMTRLEFCKEIGAWYRVNPSRLVQQTVIDDAWIYHFERTEIFSQPPGTDAENGDEPPEAGILNKALTGELKRPKIVETSPNDVEPVKDKIRKSDSSNGVNSGEVSDTIEPKLEQKDDLVTSNSGDSEVKPVKIENEPDSTVQDGKVDSTDEKLEAVTKDEVKDEAANSGSSENGSDKVDSTENVNKKVNDGKVTNGASSSVPNILAILGQKPVNGRPAQGAAPSYIPIMGPHGVTLGQLSGNQFASILAGANMTQLATLAGVNPGLLNGANLAQLAGVGNLAQLGILTQGSVGNSNVSLVGQKRPAPDLTPLPKKKQRSGRPSSETSCIFWDSGGVIHVETLESGQKLTGEVYCGMLNRLKEAMDVKRPGALDRGVLLVEDQAPEGAKPPRGLQLLPLPVNSPDLTPSDFHIFPKVKEHLRGRQKTGFVSAIEAYLKAQEDSYFKSALTEMERRCTLCVDLNGDYVEK
uniref:Mariner Mos1 transposase n=1 Tax=Lygus hesperus TaxID=30085 RepID=A0A0A9VQP8_LYGHE